MEREFQSACPNISVGCFYGGMPIRQQETQLRRGVDVVVGTPGRVIDLIDRDVLDLSQVRTRCICV